VLIKDFLRLIFSDILLILIFIVNDNHLWNIIGFKKINFI